MDKKWLKWCSQLLIPFALCASAYADISEPPVQFYQISAPSTMMQYPVFVYQGTTCAQKSGICGWKQVGYIADSSISAYVGPYDIQGSQGAAPVLTFKLVSAVLSSDETSVIGWSGGCIFSITGSAVTQNSVEPCVSGIDPIVSVDTSASTYGSNFYIIKMASLLLPPMRQNSDYPTAYHLPHYMTENRTVSFNNATQYPTIGLYNTKTSATTYVNSGTPTVKSYPGSSEIDSYVWQMGGGSATSGCTVGSACWNYSGGVFSQDPLQTYGVYATTFEATYHKAILSTVNPAIHFIANGNYDLSVVNGFNFKGILTPTEPTYCSTQTPLQYANPKGDGFIYKVSPKNVMASFPAADTQGGNVYSTTVQGLCNSISSQPLTQAYNATSQSTFSYTPPTTTFLSVFGSGNTFLGCMSPCQYATYVSSLYNSALPANKQPQQYQDFLAAYGTNNGSHNTMQDIVGQFCCSGAYSPPTNGKEACDTAGMSYPQPYPFNPPGIAINYTNNQYGLINNASYVRTMNGVVTPVKLQNQPPAAPLTNNNSPAVDFTHAAAKNAYAYQYGDPIANVGCPGDTDFTAYVFDDTTPGNNPHMTFLTKATGIEVNNLTKTGATFNWETPEDSNSTPNIQYTANVYVAGTTTLVANCQANTLTCAVTALSPNTNYQVQIVAQDGSLTSHSKRYNFTTNDPTVTLHAPALTLTAFSNTEADISWTPATDPTDPLATFSYVVNVNNGSGATITSTGATSASITGLAAGTTQYGVTVFATETAGKNQNMRINSNPITFVMETISPLPNITSIVPNAAALVATVNWTGSTISSGDGVIYYAKWNSATSAPMTFSGSGPYNYEIAPLTSGVLYTVAILACDASVPTQCVQSASQPLCIGSCSQGQLTQPSTVAANSITSSAATIGWGASQDTYSGGNISGYTVNVSTNPDATGGQQLNVGPSTLQTAVSGLTADSSYYATVTAIDNLGHTATSAVIHFTTVSSTETLTTPVLNAATGITSNAANISWSASLENPQENNQINYTVTYNGQTQVVDGATSTTLSGLKPSTTYHVTVKGCDSETSVCSQESAAITFSTTSGVVTLVAPNVSQAGSSTFTSAKIQWTGASDPNGSATFDYTVNYDNGQNNGHQDAGSNTSAMMTNLTPGQMYPVSVTATELSGGPHPGATVTSSGIIVTTATETLIAPVLAVSNVGDVTASLGWSASTGGGSDVINYTITYTDNSNNAQQIATAGTNTTYLLTGLDPYTPYSATVKACDNTTTVCSTDSNTITFTTQSIPNNPVLSNLTFNPVRGGSGNLISIEGSSVFVTCTGDPSNNCNGDSVNATIKSGYVICNSTKFTGVMNGNTLTVQMPMSFRTAKNCMATITAGYDNQTISNSEPVPNI